jgi:beta-glucanase (GH16 family)
MVSGRDDAGSGRSDPLRLTEADFLFFLGRLRRYDPRQIVTEGGNLKVTLDNVAQKGLNYTGGLMSTWNKFCFRGGYVESEWAQYSY